MLTDEQLMLEFQRGSKEAFTELFGRYREPIYGYFRRRLADAARAEELAQETFVAVLRAVARYEPRALFRTYLYGIALLQLAAERRRTAHRESSLEPAAADPPAPGNTEAEVGVRQALGKLAPEDREVLMLREYEQLSYAEIAALQRVPINTVRSRLFRARRALKELLASPRAASGG
jgi:RNA polymerase sigma-70 factor (ECF subfamily)